MLPIRLESSLDLSLHAGIMQMNESMTFYTINYIMYCKDNSKLATKCWSIDALTMFAHLIY